MTIGLISAKEEQIGIENFEIVDDLGPFADRATRVARHITHDDFVLVRGISADQALEHGVFTMPHAIRHILGRIPMFNPKVRIPTGIEHLGRGRLLPLAVAFELQGNLARFAGLERIELRADFENAGGLEINRKDDDLIARHIHRRSRGGSAAFHFGVLVRFAALPPLAGRQRFEIGKLRAEWLSCIRGRFDLRRQFQAGQHHRARGCGGGKLQDGATINRLRIVVRCHVRLLNASVIENRTRRKVGPCVAC